MFDAVDVPWLLSVACAVPLEVVACAEEVLLVPDAFALASGSPPAIAQLIIARLAPATIKLVRFNIPLTPLTGLSWYQRTTKSPNHYDPWAILINLLSNLDKIP